MQRTCSAGHVYDTDQFASCPYCNRNTRAIQFGTDNRPVTVVPGSYGGTTAPSGYGGTTAPSSYSATVSPDGYDMHVPSHNTRDKFVGKTEVPEEIRRRMQQEKEARTVGEFKRKLGYEPVVGWLVCVEGPEVGKDYRIYGRINTIGRSEDNDVVLAAEHSVSQKSHVRLAYDSRHNNYQLIPGEGSNVTYLNDQPVYAPQPLNAYDVVEMGETKLLFVPLCNEKFRWPTKKTGGNE